MIKGVTKFDGLAVGELSASFLGTNLKLEAKAAFVDSKTGDTHGWTTNHTWSPATVTKLRELKELMEVDLGLKHFENGGEVMATAAAPQQSLIPTGIGEHVGDGAVPQV